jgi:NAD(P)-dependent dehydrogenase (short-subunit alcohol dehydrogenase family)
MTETKAALAATVRVALVTGATSGIGRAIAERLAADGLRVIGTARGDVALPSRVERVTLDVGDAASVDRCMAEVLARTGRIDVLVNNAGYLQAGAVEEVSIDAAKAQFETNFFGAARMIQAVLPTMRAQKSGHIVNVTSLAGVVPLPFWGFYNASKFALEGLTETLRYEVRPFGIHVSAVEPGAIKTPFYKADHKATPMAAYATWRARLEKRMGEFEAKAPGPELVAKTVSSIVASRAPRLRYPVTSEATIFTTMRTWFPAWAFELGLRSGFRLDDDTY